MSEEELREYCKDASLEISNMQHTIERLQQENQHLKNNNKILNEQKENAYKIADGYYKENQQLKEQMVNLYKEFKLGKVSTTTEYQMICFKDEIHKKEVNELKQQRDLYKSVIDEARDVINKMINVGYGYNNTYYYATSKNSEFGCRAKVLLEKLDKLNIKERK